MNKILVLGAGQMQVPIIKKIKSRGDWCVVVDFDENAPGIKYADVALNISTNDKSAVLDAAKKYSVNGILTTSDYPVNVVAFVAKKLSLPGMSIEVAKICTNKYLQRDIFHRNGIKHPFYKLIKVVDEIKDFSDFPYIIKPIDSSASRGVKKIENLEALKEYLPVTFSFSKCGEIIIEKFIEGREFSVETLSQDGHTFIIAITEKVTKGEQWGYFVEDAHFIPANLLPQEKEMIEKEVLKAINVVGVDNCPTHTEVKLNKDGACIIEMACRLGGDYITSDLVPLATGVDMLENLIRISVGEPINVSKTINKYSAIQFLNQDNYYKCVDLLRNNDHHIIRSEIGVKHNRPIANSIDRMGYFILQSDSREEVNEYFSKVN